MRNGVMGAAYPAEADAGRLAVPGGTEPEELHVTLAYLGTTTEAPAHEVEALRVVLDGLSSTSGPFVAKLTGTARFETDDGPTYVALVQHPVLAEWGRVTARFRERKHGRKFPVWVPHVTLGTGLERGEEAARAAIGRAGGSMRVDRLALVRGEERSVWRLGAAARLAEMLRS